jgi:hypothetical protein
MTCPFVRGGGAGVRAFYVHLSFADRCGTLRMPHDKIAADVANVLEQF